MQAILLAVALLAIYAEALADYVRGQFYQQHFVFLWVFLALALSRSLRGPFRSRFDARLGRDRRGLVLALLAALTLSSSTLAGSFTGVRTSLVLFCTALALLVAPNWSIKRCLMHGLLMQLCFGIPTSAFFPLTSKLQAGVAAIISIPARLGWADYEVHATTVSFPHYELLISPDCSGIGQLLTFGGIAALGVLSSAPRRSRTIAVLLLAVALAWLSNVARVGLLVFLVGVGWTGAIDDEVWHATIGMLVFVPFVAALVWVLLRTHRPLTRAYVDDVPPGRVRVAWIVVPLVVAAILPRLREQTPLVEPGYFAALEHPPGHELALRAPSEEADRFAYQTPWLLNARFVAEEGRYFDLCHYATNSKSHLCVHYVPSCLFVLGQQERREAPVTIDGVRWWPISLDRPDPAESLHVYYAFEVGGARRDDSFATQLSVFWDRMLGGSGTVRLTRVVLPGTLPDEPTDYERGVLAWLGRTATGGR